MLMNNRSQGFEVNFYLIQKFRGITPENQSLFPKQASRQRSQIPFCTYIWARPDEHFHAIELSQLQEQGKILIACLEIEDTLFNFMIVPKHIHAQSIQSHSLDHFDPMVPVLNRDAGVVNLARIDFGI